MQTSDGDRPQGGSGSSTAISARRERERAKILEVATRLFFEKGYPGATMEAVADEMSVTKPTIYWYYRSKHDILAAISLRSAMASLRTVVPESERGEPLADLFESCRRIALASIYDVRTSAIFFREAHVLDADLRARIAEIARAYSTEIAGLLERARASGHLSFRDAQITARAIGGVIVSLHRWYRPDGEIDPHDLAIELATIMVRGAGALAFAPPDLKAPAHGGGLSVTDEPWANAYWWALDQPLHELPDTG